MIILDKIVKKEWVKALLTTAISLTLLIVIGNLITGFMRSNVSAFEVLVNQLLIFPSTLLKVLPTSCLISSLITSNNLIKTNQLVAIYSTGVTPLIVIKKILFIGFIVGVIQFLIGGYLKPYSLNRKNKLIPDLDEKFRNLEADGLMSSKITNGKMWIKKNNQFLKYQSFNQKQKRINNPTLYNLNDSFLIENYTKAKAIELNKTWTGNEVVSVINIDNRVIPKINNNKNSKVNLELSIENLKKFEQDITTLNIKKLIDYTANLEKSGLSGVKYKIIYLSIISSAINCIIFTLLGLGALFTPNKRSTSTGLIAGASFVFVILFWLVEGYLLELGKSLKINPYTSSFGLQILLIVLLFIQLFKNKRSQVL